MSFYRVWFTEKISTGKRFEPEVFSVPGRCSQLQRPKFCSRAIVSVNRQWISVKKNYAWRGIENSEKLLAFGWNSKNSSVGPRMDPEWLTMLLIMMKNTKICPRKSLKKLTRPTFWFFKSDSCSSMSFANLFCCWKVAFWSRIRILYMQDSSLNGGEIGGEWPTPSELLGLRWRGWGSKLQ